MAVFDVSKKWRILAPASIPAAWNASDELAGYISLLRNRSGLDKERPQIEDAETVSPPSAVPLVLFNAAAGSRDRNGFTWRLGKDRLEIYGDSGRGLWNALFDLLDALGFHWPAPGLEEPPAAPTPGAYPLSRDRAHCSSAASVEDRRRLVVDEKTKAKERELLIPWAARNKYDALVFSLNEKSFWNKARRGRGICKKIERYALILEAGGRDLSLLLPRRLFPFHQNMFRMDSGRRVRQHHFCSTNPKTITRIMEQAAKLFSRAMPGMAGPAGDSPQSPTRVFHLWPDQGHERSWCACPACRAFSPAEQNCISINAAADVLESLDPQARLSYLENLEGPGNHRGEIESGVPDVPGGIVLRKNIFAFTAAG